MNKTGYLIYLDDKDDYEYNLEGEYLIFENLKQVQEYCIDNDMDTSKVNIVEVKLED